jgi:predicted TIM-barrel fold metal-dependent hydrolase
MRFSNPLSSRRRARASVPIIVPHFGAGLFREALMLADLCPNVHFDTSSSNDWIRYDHGLTLSGVFRQALAVAGPDRLLFGTDSSFFPRGWVMNVYERQSAALDEIGASADVREKIFGVNFDRLFPILAARGESPA